MGVVGFGDNGSGHVGWSWSGLCGSAGLERRGGDEGWSLCEGIIFCLLLTEKNGGDIGSV